MIVYVSSLLCADEPYCNDSLSILISIAYFSVKWPLRAIHAFSMAF